LVSDSAVDIGLGVAEIVQRVCAKLPEAKVVVYNILPRTFDDNGKKLALAKFTALKEKLTKSNEQIEQLISTTLANPLVSYRKFGYNQLVNQKDNEIFGTFFDDTVHLSLKGYELWVPELKQILTSD